jgi:hypothetical protein
MCTNPHHVCLLKIAAIVHYSVSYVLAFPKSGSINKEVFPALCEYRLIME